MAKKTITIEQHERTIKNYQEQISNRDKLIRLMQADHNRTTATAGEIKNRIHAVTTFMDSFQANWNAFKVTSLSEGNMDREFNQKSFEQAHEIRVALSEIYHSNDQVLPSTGLAKSIN